MTNLTYILGSVWDSMEPSDFESQEDLNLHCEAEGYPYTELPLDYD